MSTNTPATTGNLNYVDYANYVAQTLYAAKVGTVAAIPNALATAEFNTAILTDPLQIQAYRSSVADQMNAQTGGPKFEDLGERVADITLNDTAQGASTLEVSLIDPYWILLISGFIQTDENGFLWPPIDINFPTGTDCVWRLCQVNATKDFTQPNLTLTFEDRIVSILRLMSAVNGLQQGLANQTLGGFFKMLVDSANQTLGTDIKLVELISPADPNYTVPITSTGGGPKLRKNPTKLERGLTSQQQKELAALQTSVQLYFGLSGNITISAAEQAVQQAVQPVYDRPGGSPTAYIPGLN